VRVPLQPRRPFEQSTRSIALTARAPASTHIKSAVSMFSTAQFPQQTTKTLLTGKVIRLKRYNHAGFSISVFTRKLPKPKFKKGKRPDLASFARLIVRENRH